MNQYGEVAIKAVELSKKYKSPRKSWQIAAEIIIENKSSADKGCPLSSFLGLCEEGLVKGISPDIYTSSKKNKKYAIEAVKIIKNNECNINLTPKILWEKIKKEFNIDTNHNGQMDVVLGLYENDLLNCNFT